jgi:cobalt/nickel transport protein
VNLSLKTIAAIAVLAAPLSAHFQTIIVDKSVVEQGDKSTITLRYEFTHPFEQEIMNLVKPTDAGAFIDGKKISFLGSLKEIKKGALSVWSASYAIKNPGVYQFYIDPVPYFEPAEGKFIRHQTKTIVNAFGADEGWDEPIGLKAEIAPISRPYSILAGGLFEGRVLYKGKGAPDTKVEIEFYNEGKKLNAPNDSFVTLVTKTDVNGVFRVALPLDGWWGFAALIDDDETITREGKKYPIELGAVLWLKTESYK